MNTELKTLLVADTKTFAEMSLQIVDQYVEMEYFDPAPTNEKELIKAYAGLEENEQPYWSLLEIAADHIPNYHSDLEYDKVYREASRLIKTTFNTIIINGLKRYFKITT